MDSLGTFLILATVCTAFISNFATASTDMELTAGKRSHFDNDDRNNVWDNEARTRERFPKRRPFDELASGMIGKRYSFTDFKDLPNQESFVDEIPSSEDDVNMIRKVPLDETSSGFIEKRPFDKISTGIIGKRAFDKIASGLIGKRAFDKIASGLIGKRAFDKIASGLIGKRAFDKIASGLIGKRPFDEIGSGFIGKRQLYEVDDSSFEEKSGKKWICSRV